MKGSLHKWGTHKYRKRRKMRRIIHSRRRRRPEWMNDEVIFSAELNERLCLCIVTKQSGKRQGCSDKGKKQISKQFSSFNRLLMSSYGAVLHSRYKWYTLKGMPDSVLSHIFEAKSYNAAQEPLIAVGHTHVVCKLISPPAFSFPHCVPITFRLKTR